LRSEQGAVRKEWGGRVPVCLIYPNRYEVGMSNLGFQTIYGLLNDQPQVVCERAFLPAAEDLEVLRRDSTPILSLESQRPLTDFEILAFSISFENDFINILTILHHARIPLESSARRGGEPLVVAGGVATFLNPEPVADFIDIFLLGEGEEALLEFMETYLDARGTGADREDLLHALSTLEGVYLPRYYQPIYGPAGKIQEISVHAGFPQRIKRRFVRDLDRFPTISVVRTPNTEFGRMTLIEVNRGCPRSCLFCCASSLYRPYRNRSLENLSRTAREEIQRGGRLGLTGAAVSDYPDLEALCDLIVGLGARFSLASVRLDNLTPKLGRLLKMGGVRTVTMAPEAGSERLRAVLQKGIEENDIFQAVEILLENGLFSFRLYFLIGIPSETDEDVEAIVQLTRRIKHRMLRWARSSRRLGRLTLSVNGLVPKPSTPFQWVSFEDVGNLRRKFKIIGNGLRREANIEVTHDVPKWSYIQSLLSRGDRRVGRILLAVHQSGGDWKRAFRQVDVNPDFYVYRERDREEIFPWDFIDHGVSKDRLWERYERAVR